MRCMRPHLSDGLLLGLCELLSLRAGHGAHPMRWDAVRNAAAGGRTTRQATQDGDKRKRRRQGANQATRENMAKTKTGQQRIQKMAREERKTPPEEQFKQD